MNSTRRIAALAVLLAAGWACTTPIRTGVPGVLVPIPPPQQPVEQLLENLHSSVAVTRAGAAWNLAGVAEPSDEVLHALDAALDDPDEKVREAAAWALGHAGVNPTVSRVESDATPIDEEAPQPVRITQPMYPSEAFNHRVEGTVEVEILISEAGKVVHAEVRRSIPGLDAADRACVKRWSFKPARRRGRPIPVVASAPVTFRMY
jgi:TonB family protein